MGQSRQAIKTGFFVNILAQLFESVANALSYFKFPWTWSREGFVEKVSTVHVISPLFHSNIT